MDVLNIIIEHELTLTLLHNIRIGGVYNGYGTFFWLLRFGRLECSVHIQTGHVKYEVVESGANVSEHFEMIRLVVGLFPLLPFFVWFHY